MSLKTGVTRTRSSAGFSLVEVMLAASFMALVAGGSAKVANGVFRSQRTREIIQTRSDLKQNVRRALESFALTASQADLEQNPEFVACKNGGAEEFICEEGKRYDLTIMRAQGILLTGTSKHPARYRADGTPCAPGEFAGTRCPIEVVATFSPECGGKGICRERISRFHYDCEVRGAKGVDLSQYGFKEMAPALCSIDDSSASARSSTALAAVDPSMIPGDFYRNAWDLCKSSSFKGSCAERKVQGGTVYDIRVPQNTTLIRFGRDSALGVGKETQFPLIYKSGSVIWADGSNFGIVDGRFHEDDFFVVDNKAPIPRRDPRRSAGVQAAAYLCQGKRACDFARVPVGMTLIHGEAGVPVREGSTIPGCSEEASGSVSSRCFTVLLRSVLVENSEIY